MVHNDGDSNEPANEEVEVETKEEELPMVIVELDALMGMLSIQAKLRDSMTSNDGSWRRSSVFKSIVACLGRSCLLYINSDSTANGVSKQLMSQVGLPTEPIDKPYQVALMSSSTFIWEVMQRSRM